MMENKTNAFLVAIVAIVAVTGLIISLTGGSNAGLELGGDDSAIAGQAVRTSSAQQQAVSQAKSASSDKRSYLEYGEISSGAMRNSNDEESCYDEIQRCYDNDYTMAYYTCYGEMMTKVNNVCATYDASLQSECKSDGERWAMSECAKAGQDAQDQCEQRAGCQ